VHVALMREKGNFQEIRGRGRERRCLVKRPLERHRLRSEDTIKTDRKKGRRLD